jgi:nitrite reductase/ring-hydroxylating ferredoxin subunit
LADVGTEGWVRVCSVNDLASAELFAVEANGERVVLCNVDGELYALEDQCSHQDYPLADGTLEGYKLECIYHGACFDVRSGRAVKLPAIKPVKTYEVDVRGDDVLVKVEG